MSRAAELVEAAKTLVAAGRWEQADALLAQEPAHPDVAYALAETAVDAALWRHGGARGAAHDRGAVLLLAAALERRGTLDVATRLLTLRYRLQRLMFAQADRSDGATDRSAALALADDLAELAEQTCTDCDPTSGWNAFYLGHCYSNLLDDQAHAAPLFAEAQLRARRRGDRLAESYPLRQLAAQAHADGQTDDALVLAYRSLALRLAAGAAPAVAAQQLMVVELELVTGGDNRTLRAMVDAAAETARALDLPWVAPAAAKLRQALTAGV
jgi:hypothetical protein